MPPHPAHTSSAAPGDSTAVITKPGEAKIPDPIITPYVRVDGGVGPTRAARVQHAERGGYREQHHRRRFSERLVVVAGHGLSNTSAAESAWMAGAVGTAGRLPASCLVMHKMGAKGADGSAVGM